MGGNAMGHGGLMALPETCPARGRACLTEPMIDFRGISSETFADLPHPTPPERELIAPALPCG
jgi:hypothetical protein